MQPKSTCTRLRAVAASFAVALFVSSAWATDHKTVLYNFDNNDNDGSGGTSLIRDAAGNLYGTTSNGGIYECGYQNCGTVFELSPVARGGWTETVLHSFGNGTDGVGPNGLIMDAAGNLYGLTETGGQYGAGIAYELSPSQGGGWTETVLYSFSSSGYGNGSYSLVRDASGNLYGTMFFDGAYGEGMVFELSPSQGGSWTETVLHSFGSGTDGQYPLAGLMMDAAGNLYGTTAYGGIDTHGTVFELSPSEGGGWNETVLHGFNGNDGSQPWASPIMDAAGNLYGTTSQGGAYCAPFGCGTVFELSPSGGGGWTETVLHSFNFYEDAHDGWSPLAALILDTAGNLYGTTLYGGINLYGIVFKLSPNGSAWTETVLYSFGSGNDGGELWGSVVMDGVGDLYGTTGFGGVYNSGTAYELTPSSIRLGPSVPH